MPSYAVDTTLTPSGDGRWTVALAERWNVGRNQNGGVLLAAAVAAMAEVAGQPDPLTVTGHFLAATEAGPATIEAAVVKPGRTYATAGGSLHQADRERLRAVGAFADLSARGGGGPTAVTAAPPALPAPDACDDLFDALVAGPAGERALTRSIRNFEIRVDPAAGWGVGADGAPALDGWIRFVDEATVTTTMLVALADAFPPTLLALANLGWLPTVELTVHVLALPAADEPWLRARLRTRSVVDGLVEEDGELWDATGTLVARFRQLALLIPKP